MKQIVYLGSNFFQLGNDYIYERGALNVKSYIATGNITITDKAGQCLYQSVNYSEFYDPNRQDDPDNPVPFGSLSEFEAAWYSYCVVPVNNASGTPTGPAGGDLMGNYPNPTLNANASAFTAPKAQTLPMVYVPSDDNPTNYDVQPTDCVIYANSYNSNPTNITLPDASAVASRVITVYCLNSGGGNVSVSGGGLGDSGTITLQDSEAVTMQSYGDRWRIISMFKTSLDEITLTVAIDGSAANGRYATTIPTGYTKAFATLEGNALSGPLEHALIMGANIFGTDLIVYTWTTEGLAPTGSYTANIILKP